MPFDPPLDHAVQYRWEKTEVKTGRTRMSWHVADYAFEEVKGGYRLTVKPVSQGSNETDPARLAVEKKLNELLNIPFVLRLNHDAEILELEEGDRYWSTIVKVLREELERLAKDEKKPEFAKVIETIISMYEKMPAEARLGLLTESIQPAFEFANLEVDSGTPISAQVDGLSPFGGKIARDVVISLVKVVDDQAYLAIKTTISPREMERMVGTVLRQLAASAPAESQAKMEAALKSLKGFQHESRADYRVSTADGMVDEMLSTETVRVEAEGKTEQRVITRSLKRVY